MKFFTLFAAGAMATSVVKRDLAGVISDIKAITSATGDLDTAINGIQGADSKDAVLSANEKVLSAIATATSDANELSTLSLEDALSITPSVNDLAKAVDTAIDDLISKKDTIVSAGFGGTTSEQLSKQQTAAKKFSDTLTSKVPTAAQGIAAGLSAPILASLAKGVDAFQGEKDTAGGSSSSSSAAASSSAPASSSAAAGSSSSASEVATSSAAASTPASYGTSAAATSSGAAYSTGAPMAGGNSTSPSSSPVPYTGAAGMNVAGFGGVLAAAALVAAF